MSRNRILLLSSLLLLSVCASAQIAVVGLPHDRAPQKSINKVSVKPASARTMAAVELPFFDDFSATKTTYADTLKWTSGKSIRVNDGMGIRPPSVKVATFDGLDSLGKPYTVTDVLAKGYADKLESVAINLKAVPQAERNSVYFSYYYQLKGRGEIPDTGDRLLISFRDSLKHWIPVDTIENNGAMDIDLFYASIMPVNEPRWFHANFAFRIQNFSRLSGPYDTWNVDYIYLNKGRSSADLNFPDRTISESVTKLFGPYTIIPRKHFLSDTTIKSKPTFLATNLRVDLDQIVDYFSRAYITYFKNKDTVALPYVRLDSVNNTGQQAIILKKNVFTPIPLDTLPGLRKLAANNDSLIVDLNVILYAKDNLPINQAGDYDAAKYAPIDFRNNDSTTARFILTDKYAYDDGVAEYGAGLNQPGAELQYRYEIVGGPKDKKGFISHLEMYFPRFGDEASQVIELRIWNNLTDAKPIYTEVTTLTRSQQNVFWKKTLTQRVFVDSVFYIGWKQNSSAAIAVGLDKNSDTGSRMYYNTNGVWIQNTLVQGNLMFRPVFGEGTIPIIDGLEDEKILSVYPNPGDGNFHFTGTAEHIVVYDMTGRNTPFRSERSFDETIVSIAASPGIYIIKAYQDGVMRTAKVLIRQ